jgi:hypothetical protein
MEGILGLIGVFLGSGITLSVSYFNRKSTLTIHQLDRKDKYCLAAIEKRLEVHQTAFNLWTDLINVLFDDSKRAFVVSEAYKF